MLVEVHLAFGLVILKRNHGIINIPFCTTRQGGGRHLDGAGVRIIPDSAVEMGYSKRMGNEGLLVKG